MVGGFVIYLFAPWVNTRTAPRYSEINFRLIECGISTNELVARLGPPLWTVESNDGGGVETWCYTHWGKVCDWDGTWFNRSMMVSNGVVIEKYASR
jgi:hypothetical protein